MTNTATRHHDDLLQDLQQLGFAGGALRTGHGSSAARSWLERQQRRPLALVHPAIGPLFAGSTSEPPDCVLLGDGRDLLNYANLYAAQELLMQEAPLIGIGRNRRFREAGRWMLDAAAFLEYGADCTALVIGKPSAECFAEVVRSLGLPAEACLMVGDDVEADVCGAAEAGLRAWLVQTGKYRPGDERGTLPQAWASHASLKRIDGQDDPPPPPTGPGEGFGAPQDGKKRAKGDFRGIKLSNETHRSSTDPEALLARKSNAHPAQLSYRGHVLMDNRHDLIVDCRVTQATGTGERDAAKEMAADLSDAHQKTIGADKSYDTKGFVAEMRRLGVTPHVAQNTARSGGSVIDGRTTRHVGYAMSINARWGIEKVLGWIKAFGGRRQFKLRGQDKVRAVFGLHVIAYNLIRLGNLL